MATITFETDRDRNGLADLLVIAAPKALARIVEFVRKRGTSFHAERGCLRLPYMGDSELARERILAACGAK